MDVLRTQGLTGQEQRDGRVHPPRDPDHDSRETAAAPDLFPDELHERPLHELGIDFQELLTRRRQGRLVVGPSPGEGRGLDPGLDGKVELLPPALPSGHCQRSLQMGQHLLQVGEER